MRGAVVARDTPLPSDGAWETFDLALYAEEIERLVAVPDSDVARAVAAGTEGARYHLRAACDGCPYNALCFTDTAERADLSLVPLITLSEKRALQAEGIDSARTLASLMEYGGRRMRPANGLEETARRASARWPLGGRLPLLAQRARAAVRRLDRSTEAKPYIVGADFGSLPDPAEHPGLVRVFVDAQRDYIEDRLYLLAARIAGPRETAEVVEMTDAPPTTETRARAARLASCRSSCPRSRARPKPQVRRSTSTPTRRAASVRCSTRSRATSTRSAPSRPSTTF